jgi:hypothetical protein
MAAGPPLPLLDRDGPGLDAVHPKLTQSGGFAGRRDRQLSTVSELQSILDAPFPSCRANPCTRIPGLTASSPYWSSTTGSGDEGLNAWLVHVNDAFVSGAGKGNAFFARAVRGRS